MAPSLAKILLCPSLDIFVASFILLHNPQIKVSFKRVYYPILCAIKIENFGNIGTENKFIEIIAALGKYVYNSMIKHSTANPSEHSKKENAKKEYKAE